MSFKAFEPGAKIPTNPQPEVEPGCEIEYQLEGLGRDELGQLIIILQTYSLLWAKHPAGAMEFDSIVEINPNAPSSTSDQSKLARVAFCRKLLGLLHTLSAAGGPSSLHMNLLPEGRLITAARVSRLAALDENSLGQIEEGGV